MEFKGIELLRVSLTGTDCIGDYYQIESSDIVVSFVYKNIRIVASEYGKSQCNNANRHYDTFEKRYKISEHEMNNEVFGIANKMMKKAYGKVVPYTLMIIDNESNWITPGLTRSTYISAPVYNLKNDSNGEYNLGVLNTGAGAQTRKWGSCKGEFSEGSIAF